MDTCLCFRYLTLITTFHVSASAYITNGSRVDAYSQRKNDTHRAVSRCQNLYEYACDPKLINAGVLEETETHRYEKMLKFLESGISHPDKRVQFFASLFKECKSTEQNQFYSSQVMVAVNKMCFAERIFNLSDSLSDVDISNVLLDLMHNFAAQPLLTFVQKGDGFKLQPSNMFYVLHNENATMLLDKFIGGELARNVSKIIEALEKDEYGRFSDYDNVSMDDLKSYSTDSQIDFYRIVNGVVNGKFFDRVNISNSTVIRLSKSYRLLLNNLLENLGKRSMLALIFLTTLFSVEEDMDVRNTPDFFSERQCLKHVANSAVALFYPLYYKYSGNSSRRDAFVSFVKTVKEVFVEDVLEEANFTKNFPTKAVNKAKHLGFSVDVPQILQDIVNNFSTNVTKSNTAHILDAPVSSSAPQSPMNIQPDDDFFIKILKLRTTQESFSQQYAFRSFDEAYEDFLKYPSSPAFFVFYNGNKNELDFNPAILDKTYFDMNSLAFYHYSLSVVASAFSAVLLSEMTADDMEKLRQYFEVCKSSNNNYTSADSDAFLDVEEVARLRTFSPQSYPFFDNVALRYKLMGHISAKIALKVYDRSAKYPLKALQFFVNFFRSHCTKVMPFNMAAKDTFMWSALFQDAFKCNTLPSSDCH